MDMKYFDQRMLTHGWVIFERVVAPELVLHMLADMDKAYEVCRAIQMKNGIGDQTSGTVHHLIGLGDSFMEYLSVMPVAACIERHFGGKYILNSFGGNNNSRQLGSYANVVHRDIRS